MGRLAKVYGTMAASTSRFVHIVNKQKGCGYVIDGV